MQHVYGKVFQSLIILMHLEKGKKLQNNTKSTSRFEVRGIKKTGF